MRQLLILFALLMTASMPALARPAKIKTSEDLLRAMQEKYEGKWYRTITFTQKTTEYRPDGTSHASIWYEALAMPGKLRIDFDPIKDGNGILFTNDTVYDIKGGKVAGSHAMVHPLLVLGFDVYFQPVEQTATKLKNLGFDLSVLREDTWQNRPVYVVGAKSGDLHSSQFWIDKEHLYFVRMFQPAGRDKKQTAETQFNKYEKAKGGGWVSPEVIFFVDGKRVVLEEYSDIRTNVTLDNKLFDPQSWTTAEHWRK